MSIILKIGPIGLMRQRPTLRAPFPEAAHHFFRVVLLAVILKTEVKWLSPGRPAVEPLVMNYFFFFGVLLLPPELFPRWVL